MGEAVGANSVDLNQVQVHPTGLVHPDDPNAKVKFLAAEALRGVGGVLIDKDGNRFCDELGRRDYVTGEMWKRNKGPYRLILNKAAGKEIEWHCKHYQGRGLMKFFESGTALAKEMGINPQNLRTTLEKYNTGAKEKKDQFGKRFFHNVPFQFDDNFWAAILCPVIHYCMGGLQISTESEVVNKQGKVIPGLFAAGEVTGGVHGDNRLGGSSLQDCVVFGRVAGGAAARYLFNSALTVISTGSATADKRLGGISRQLFNGPDTTIQTTIAQPGLQANVFVQPKDGSLRMEFVWDRNAASNAGLPVVNVSGPVSAPVSSSSSKTETKSTPAQSANNNKATTAAPAQNKASSTAAAAKPATPSKEYTLDEVAKHKTEKDCWVVVNGQVLDATTFLKDHPGGKQAILLYAGKDATAEFNMLHKPDVVQKYAPHTIIGTLKGGSDKKAKH
jgi:cytochrome b involved in lipid metabolism